MPCMLHACSMNVHDASCHLDYCAMCTPGTYQDARGQSSCTNCPRGYVSSKMKDRCGACPEGTWSDGSGAQCVTCIGSADCPCLATPYPCFPDTRCFNYKNGGTPAHVCDVCPPGYHGDGVTCTDVDEVCVGWWENHSSVKCSSLVVECRTRNRESPGSNPPLLPFRSLSIFVLFTSPLSTQLYKRAPCYRQFWTCVCE